MEEKFFVENNDIANQVRKQKFYDDKKGNPVTKIIKDTLHCPVIYKSKRTIDYDIQGQKWLIFFHKIPYLNRPSMILKYRYTMNGGNQLTLIIQGEKYLLDAKILAEALFDHLKKPMLIEIDTEWINAMYTEWSTSCALFVLIVVALIWLYDVVVLGV